MSKIQGFILYRIWYGDEPFEIRDDFGVLYKTSHISNCPYCGRFLTENYS